MSEIDSNTTSETERFRPYLLGCSLVAALGGLLFGFDTAVISGTTEALRAEFSLTDGTLGFTVASALIGTILGSLLAGKPADWIGRRTVLAWLGIFYFVSALGCAFAWDWWSFVSFRLLGGLAVGGASVVSPLYTAEISPARFRGRMVAITQFNVVLGILLAYVSNYIIGQLDLGETEWRWMFGVEAAPALLFFLLIFFVPRSPRWLLAQGREEEARLVFSKVGTDTGDIESEIREVQASLDLEHHSLKERFFQKRYSKPILLAFALAAFNQLSGINAILYYTPDIFRAAGAATDSALLQSVIVGATMFLFTILAMLIIDHFGRKQLMIWGSVGYVVGLLGATYAFFASVEGPLLLISLLVFIAAHGFGQGAVIWVFISEIFPNRVRARGQALGSFTHWGMNAMIAWTFPIIAGGFAIWLPFAFFSVCMVGQLLWVLLVMPETKGVPLEEIQEKMGIE